MKLLFDKVALITGASRGIGRAIALRFAAEGCNIAFTYSQNEAAAKQVLDEVVKNGVECRMYKSDAAEFENAHALVTEVVKDFGHIDVLVNNAGITRDALMLRMTEDKWDEVITTNLKSAFNYTHAVMPLMMRQRSGSIISMSSLVGLTGNAGQASYAASKAGIIALMQSVAKEMGSRGVRANAIAPGYIETDMTNAIPDQIKQDMTKMIPMQRVGSPDEVAKVALFLASDLSSYVSGQVISVNGAMN